MEGNRPFWGTRGGAVQFTKDLAEDFDLVIHTCRCNPEMHKPLAVHLLVNRVRDWLDEHGFVYHDIYAGTGKPIASAYVDDRAVVCRPRDNGAADFVAAKHAVRELTNSYPPPT